MYYIYIIYMLMMFCVGCFAFRYVFEPPKTKYCCLKESLLLNSGLWHGHWRFPASSASCSWLTGWLLQSQAKWWLWVRWLMWGSKDILIQLTSTIFGMIWLQMHTTGLSAYHVLTTYHVFVCVYVSVVVVIGFALLATSRCQGVGHSMTLALKTWD